MKFSQEVNLMEKRGNLKGYSSDMKEKFVDVCNSNFFFYDPYKDLLINPITSKKFWPKSLQNIFSYSESSLKDRLNSKSPTAVQLEFALNRLATSKKRAYTLHYVFINNLKFIGLLIGGILAYFVDLYIGLALGLYLVYFDFNTYDKVNGVISQIQGGFMTSMLWQEKRKLYFFGSVFLLLGALTALYLLIDSLWLVFVFFVSQKFILVNPIVQFITSSVYRGSEIAINLEEEFEKQKEIDDFLDLYPSGLKLNEIDFYSDELCEFGEVEELSLSYETSGETYNRKHLFLYSNESIRSIDVENELYSDNVVQQILRLDNNNKVEFYFENIRNVPGSPYFVIAKEDFMSIYEFEGTNAKCVAKSFYDNRNVDCYIEYENGIKNGKMIEFHKNGEKHVECFFKDGLLLPQYYELKYEDGKPMMRGELRAIENRNPKHEDLYDPNSKFRIGIWEIFNNDGVLMKSVEYKLNGSKETIQEDNKKTMDYIWL
jgi:antitoxin component YwqK of YwqJK toxin-antitoxin module